MPLSTLTKPNFNTQSGSQYKVAIDNIIADIADKEVEGQGSSARPLFSAAFKNSLAFDGVGHIQFTRGGDASFIDRYGLMQTAAADEPRFEKAGLLLEGSSTNLFTRAEEFEHADWSKNNCTITSDAAQAMDGTATADKLVEDGTTNTHFVEQQQLFQANTPYTFSVFVEPAERDQIRLVSSPNGFEVDFVLTGQGTATIAAGAGVGYGIKKYGSVYRCWITVNLGTGIFTDSQIHLNNGAGALYSGDGVSGVYIWGAQVEELSLASSYIKTVAGNVTRQADICELTIPGNLPGLDDEISVICDVDILGINTESNQYILDDGNVTQFLLLASLVAQGNVVHADMGGLADFSSVLTPHLVTRIGVSNDANLARGYFNGTLEASVARTAQIGSYNNVLSIGNKNNFQNLYGHLSNLQIYDAALPAGHFGGA